MHLCLIIQKQTYGNIFLCYFVKNIMKNSCGSEGCRVRIILPHDSRSTDVRSRGNERGNDTRKIQRISSKTIQRKAA